VQGRIDGHVEVHIHGAGDGHRQLEGSTFEAGALHTLGHIKDPQYGHSH